MNIAAGNDVFELFRIRRKSVYVVKNPDRKKNVSIANEPPKVNCCATEPNMSSKARWSSVPTLACYASAQMNTTAGGIERDLVKLTIRSEVCAKMIHNMENDRIPSSPESVREAAVSNKELSADRTLKQ